MNSTMKIVHFSISPLAGAPLRLVQALQRHTNHLVRLIDLVPNPVFGEDIVFPRQQEEAISLAESADILHLHNYLHVRSTQFAPIDFDALRRRGVRIVRHFHSTPDIVMQNGRLSHEEVFDGLPAIVCGQFQERYFPEARVMPLVVPENDPAYIPPAEPGQGVFFGPTNHWDLFERRWHAKGTHETRRMIARACNGTSNPFHFIMDKPLADSLNAKRRAAIVIDELITGGYHTTTLEGLCLGRAVMTWLDLRTRRVFAEMAGTPSCPVINVHLSEAETVVRHLLTHDDETQALGRMSREWFVQHWSEAKVAGMFDDMYRGLMESPEKVQRQPALRLEDAAARFHAITLPDFIHETRRRHWLRTAPVPDRFLVLGRIANRRLRKAIKKIPGVQAIYAALCGERKDP
ncbi:MAG TPA: glycosyltransferase family 1 protein [Candidatus Hydrogenedentes bacterium]|nr:glycosyltransferase family 1 protein [Candidatus Hydrogenedentota bacterium]